MDTRTLKRTVTADNKTAAEKQVIEALAATFDNVQIDTTTPVKTFEVSVLAWDNPVTDQLGNQINEGDNVLFGSSESIRVGRVDWAARSVVKVIAEDTGYTNYRLPKNLIVMPANLTTEPVVTQRLAIATV